MFTCHLYFFFGEVSISVIGLLLNRVVFLFLNFKCSLHILGNSPLSDICSANIFSQSVTCILILLILPLAEQRFYFE